MIYALNDKNEKINASKGEKGKIYYCPNLDCENRELILRKGDIRITHFAHKSLTDCISEPESEAHILCKIFFQSLLDLDKKFVEYYGIEGVRPDVLYNQFALEIQCSPITVNEVKRRNKKYGENGYVVIWIFLEDEFISIKKTKDQKTNYRIKKPVLHASYKDIGRFNSKIFSFKCKNEEIHVNFNDYLEFLDEFTKQNEQVINTKQDFDRILEEILVLIKNKKELRDLTNKLNSLPKRIQGQIFERSNLNYAHISAYDFYDGVNNFTIGMFIDAIFREKNLSMEGFKDYIEKLINEAYIKEKKIEDWQERNIKDAHIKEKKIEDWRERNTFEKNGKKYIPLCKLINIYRESPGAYLVWSNQWIPKSISYKDDKYLYCEDWKYKKIEKRFKEE